MDPIKEYLKLETRRQFFSKCASGLGTAALASLLPNAVVNALESQAKPRFGGLPELPHFAPKAKQAIYLFMSGAPSSWICMTTNRIWGNGSIPTSQSLSEWGNASPR